MKKIIEQLIKFGIQDTTLDSLKIQFNSKFQDLNRKMITQLQVIKYKSVA